MSKPLFKCLNKESISDRMPTWGWDKVNTCSTKYHSQAHLSYIFHDIYRGPGSGCPWATARLDHSYIRPWRHVKLDTMRWFSHRRRTGGRNNCTSYLLMDIVSWPTATPAATVMLKIFPKHTPHARPPWPLSKKCRTLSFFLSLVTLTFDLWFPYSNSGEIFVHCT